MPCLVLDAMGVIFAAADDVAELLIPYVIEQGGSSDEAIIQSAYHEASLGQISADEFWLRVDVSPQKEDDYLARHRLNDGAIETLTLARDNAVPIWCLSNDVGRWSRKLRERLGVDGYLQGSIISSDVGIRKPDDGIYQALIDSSGYAPGDLLLVDDRVRNISAARGLGIESVLFDPERRFNEVQSWLANPLTRG